MLGDDHCRSHPIGTFDRGEPRGRPPTRGRRVPSQYSRRGPPSPTLIRARKARAEPRPRTPRSKMGYRSLADCVEDLRRTGRLVAIDQPISPDLEAAAIQRRLYEAGGPAVFFRRVEGTDFPMVGNLFGTMDRVHYIFRDTLEAVRHLVELKVKPPGRPRPPLAVSRRPLHRPPHLLPRRVRAEDRSSHQRTTLGKLPRLKSWPDDGGPFVTLPEVYSEDPDRPGLAKSNLGMYRVQLSGNRLRARRRGRPPLPAPSRDRRPSRRRDPPGRAPPRHGLRRRAPRRCPSPP